MRRACAITHVAFEDLDGLDDLIRGHGYDLVYVDALEFPARAAELGSADLLFVLGGPIGAYETAAYPFLRSELALLRERLQAGRATCGICLGSQLMAAALGAKVSPGGNGKEIGWKPVELTGAGARSPLRHLEAVPVLHWHGDTFTPPPGAIRLASTAQYANQAFAFGEHALALQFHCEVTAAGLERWYIGHAAEIASTAGVTVESLRAQAAEYAGRAAAAGRAVMGEWLGGLAPVPSV